MHLPLTWMVPSDSTVQFCSWLPLQSPMTTGVSFAAESLLSSTHLALLSPATIGPVIPPGGSGVTVAGALAPESPAVVWATTVTMKVLPLASPVILQVVAPVVAQVLPPGDAVAV